MNLKKLDISGFKSFCDQTSIIFDNSVTAVVGPNGCGKSNIVDAIRWVLGEQSAKNLRGHAMDDVIFNGSESRGQQSLAEVTITFDNTDGLSDPDYREFTEVSVTRRLYRDGTSEYLINKSPCRLMDITNLFLGTGGGARAYSIIEQGRIGLIVSSRSEDRRSMIEEAAGITKYKNARKAAERKMEKTSQNLLRIGDIINEMERNLSSLKRQAKKAERYKSYRDEQTDLDLYISAHRYLELRAEAMVISGALCKKEDELQTARNALDALETHIVALKLNEQSIKSRMDEEIGAEYETNKEIQIIENEIRHLTAAVARFRQGEQTSLEQEARARAQISKMEDESSLLVQKIEKMEKDLAVVKERYEESLSLVNQAKSRLAALADTHNAKRDQLSRSRARQSACDAAIRNFGQRIEENKGRLESALREREALNVRANELKELALNLEEKAALVEKNLRDTHLAEEREIEILDQLKCKVDEIDKDRRSVRDSLQADISRKSSLEEVMNSLESHDRAVREAVELVERESGDLLKGLLIDYIDCGEKYEKALAAALNDRLQALIVNDRESGMKLLQLLKDRDMGRVTVLAEKGLAAEEPKNSLLTGQGVLGLLIDFLNIDKNAHEFAQKLLQDVYVVDGIEKAEQLWRDSLNKATLVTLDGQVLEANGVMRGGRSNTAGADLLSQKRRIKELSQKIKDLKTEHRQLDERFETIKDELEMRREACEASRQEAQLHEIALAEIRKDKARSIEDIERLGQRFEAMDREIAHQRELISRATEDLRKAETEKSDTGKEIEDLERSIATREAEIKECRDEHDRLVSFVSDLRVQQAELDQQWQGATQRLEKIAGMRMETGIDLEKLSVKRLEAVSEAGRCAGEAFRHKEDLAAKLEDAKLSKEKIKELRDELAAQEGEISSAEAMNKSKRHGVEEISHEITDLKMKKQEAALAVNHLLQSARERNYCDLLRVLGDYHMRPVPTEDTRARIDDLNHIIERMGPINLAAIDEFEQENTRYEELAQQRNDLKQAMQNLEQAISQMDKESRRRFKETFEDVNQKFKELFPRLFKGGRAELILTDPSDMLATGVDISAQPPGKRLGNVELLSGGEKAFTATALLFAIFLHRPSPFCILDEVDAPLDEANVDRFIDLIHQMTNRTQFIIITHSKLTMERSDALYGVTMEEAGVSKIVSVRLNTKTETTMAANS